MSNFNDDDGNISKLNNVFDDLNIRDHIDDFIKLPNDEVTSEYVRTTISREKLAEIHCVALCFNTEGRIIPGVIFLANVTNADDVEKKFSKQKHTEIKWFNPSEIDTVNPGEYIPDFQNTVQRALLLRNQINRTV